MNYAPFPLCFDMKRPLNDRGHLKAAYDECVRLGTVGRHDLASLDGEVIEWIRIGSHRLRLILEPNETSIVKEQKISGPPVFYMLTCKVLISSHKAIER